MTTSMHSLVERLPLPPWVQGDHAQLLSSVERDSCHTAVWRRDLAPAVLACARRLCDEGVDVTVSPEDLGRALPDGPNRDLFIADVQALARRFAPLAGEPFEVHLGTVTTDKCRKFHVDHYQLRLVTTYVGRGTEWIPEEHVQRDALAARGLGVDAFNQAVASPHHIRRLAVGDVLLMKGRGWKKGPQAGLGGPIHRSPPIEHEGTRRLVLTMTV